MGRHSKIGQMHKVVNDTISQYRPTPVALLRLWRNHSAAASGRPGRMEA